LGEGQKPELLSSEARGGRGLGAMTVGRSLLLFGFVCLTVMVFTHVAEGLHLFSGMGWGLPDSPGGWQPSGATPVDITAELYNNMVMKALDDTFSALSDPTRRAILARLALGEATATELAEPFDISQPAISRHLRVLEEASLISRSLLDANEGNI
jgi:hypothetical protein